MSLDIFDRFERLLGTGYLVPPRQSLWQESESFLVTQLVGRPTSLLPELRLCSLGDSKFYFGVDWNF
jgi:hypothetical protein